MTAARSKVAIVTRGGRGIGRAVAIALGRKDASLVVNCPANHEAASETVKAVEAAGGKVRAVQGKLDG
jgi:3-oxoacyl-[acyl-carrier protein] reductase